MRLMECLRLRVKDIDFGSGEIIIREGKGDKDRHTMLPEKIRTALQRLSLLTIVVLKPSNNTKNCATIF